jgi:hypothetical protein
MGGRIKMTEFDMNETRLLRSRIENIYKVFERYPRPSKIEYCPCGCTKADEVAPLLASPLRELDFKSLENFSFSAMTTQGSVNDFKYFLPRLLEGIAQEPYGYNPEILFGKLGYGNGLTWDEQETLAIRGYMRALWTLGLRSFPIERSLPAFCEIETLLASLAATGDSLGSYLALWDETDVAAADQHLIHFVTLYGTNFAAGKSLDFAFWEKLREQSEELRRWLLKPETLDRVVRSRHLLEIDGYEHLFEPALQVIQAESIAAGS